MLDQYWLDRIVLDQGELAGCGFHEVAGIGTVTIPRLARRIAQGDRARREGVTLYLESGEVVA
ncbi:hypothetical protein [Nocardiopsis prasina]|uniref:hypothetical protein n=1 Tax=Nocardiopsis prasina TaxID=2015 RepID=UPI000348B67B